MKLFKKIIIAVLALIVVLFLGGYFYFDQKFTPEKNYLTVKKESGKVPITWVGTDKNALLIPVYFPGDTTKYYLQFDTGAIYTVFYSEPIKDLKAIENNGVRAKATFTIGTTKISSDAFKILEKGKAINDKDSIKIIGTLGADVLENHKTIINLRENYVVLNVSKMPKTFENKIVDFKFKKRKVIIEAIFQGNKEKFLYDSGTSAYELLTSKEVWNNIKLPQSKVTIEKAQSTDNILTAYTATCNDTIIFKNKTVPLNQVTYVEGFSQAQYLLMKFSGMTGMLGNKIFIKNCIYIDGVTMKMAID